MYVGTAVTVLSNLVVHAVMISARPRVVIYLREHGIDAQGLEENWTSSRSTSSMNSCISCCNFSSAERLAWFCTRGSLECISCCTSRQMLHSLKDFSLIAVKYPEVPAKWLCNRRLFRVLTEVATAHHPCTERFSVDHTMAGNMAAASTKICAEYSLRDYSPFIFDPKIQLWTRWTTGVSILEYKSSFHVRRIWSRPFRAKGETLVSRPNLLQTLRSTSQNWKKLAGCIRAGWGFGLCSPPESATP